MEDPNELLTPQEVAALFKVDAKTVTRWSDAGKLSSVRTLGGHRRFFKSEVQALFAKTRFTLKGEPGPEMVRFHGGEVITINESE